VNPRLQSRPGHFRKNSRSTSEGEQFEGDYERFDSEHSDATRSQSAHKQRYEDSAPRHKSRPKDTQFWSEVNQERDELLESMEVVEGDSETETGAFEAPAKEGVTPKVARKNRARRPASAIVRNRRSSER